MITHPEKIQDVYLLSSFLSGFLAFITLIFAPFALLVSIAVLLPFLFVTIRLVILSDSYTEENFVQIPTETFILFFVSGIVVIVLLYGLSVPQVYYLWVMVLLFFTAFPFLFLRQKIGDSYTDIDFGFRSVLPESELWKSATVFLYNGEIARYSISKFCWYKLANHRFTSLVNTLDPENPYSNHTIAKSYQTATEVTLSSGELVPNEAEFGPIFESFITQRCLRCTESKPVTEMYLLTDNGEIAEAFCADCINKGDMTGESASASASANENTTDTKEFEMEETTVDDSIKNALDVFGYSRETLPSLTEEDLQDRYHTLVQQKHPDAGGNEDEFKIVVESYEELQQHISKN